jgi:hypothetical protein
MVTEQTRQNKTNSIISVIGKKGSGKTVLTEMIAITLDKPIIIADLRGQYPTTPRRRLLFENPKSLSLWLANNDNFIDFYKYKLEIVCNITVENFIELSSLVARMKNITFIVDEIDIFLSPTSISHAHPIYHLINTGRHQQINIITTSRRPADIPRTLTSQTDEFYFARLSEPIDLEYVKKSVGDKYISIVRALREYQFLYIRDDFFKIVTTKKDDIDLIDKL